MNYIDSHDNVDVMLNTRATEILVDENGKACGVVATGETGNTVTVKASKGVVVATGGFAANVELRSAYNTQWADLGDSIKSTNHAGATGDGIKMLQKLGADFVQMGNIQLLPLGDEVHVYPGHGPETTLGHETLYNPFIVEVLNHEVNYRD